MVKLISDLVAWIEATHVVFPSRERLETRFPLLEKIYRLLHILSCNCCRATSRILNFENCYVFAIRKEIYMPTDVIVQELNSEIERLTKARDLLTGTNAMRSGVRMVRRRRPMSAATKAKIAAAMAKRWAVRRKKTA
jgi:hypothetical protein